MTIEQEARDMLARAGVEDAQSFTAGDLVEIANLIASHRRLSVQDPPAVSMPGAAE